MENIEKLIKLTKEAIAESKTPFNKIPMDSILTFLSGNGVKDASMRKNIYKALSEHYSFMDEFDTRKSTNPAEEKVDKQDVPTKQPRRSVFGEIKRIA